MNDKKCIFGVIITSILLITVFAVIWLGKNDKETNQNNVTTPTASVMLDPTSVPTEEPTKEPTKAPTKVPTSIPTAVPKVTEELIPTSEPVVEPTKAPTEIPTLTVTATPEPMATLTPTSTANPISEPTATLIPTPEPTATSKPTATPTPKLTEVLVEDITKTLGKANVGEYVMFGRYEQDNDKWNGAEEIEWMVLDKKDGKMLLLSKHIIENKVFHQQWGVEVTWDMCDLRIWLNGEFYKTAFHSTEQNLIETTHLTTPMSEENIMYGIRGAEDTDDKVFVLSVEEALTYFDPNYKTEDPLRMSQPTAYAAAQGVRVYNREQYPELKGNGWWWLRTPGDSAVGNLFTAYVSQAGAINLGGTDANYEDYAGVRPALWVNVE